MNTENANSAIGHSRWKDYLNDFTSRNRNRPARLVVGWAVSESLEAGFDERAFLQGQSRRGGGVSPIIHSDRGRKSRRRCIQRKAGVMGLRDPIEGEPPQARQLKGAVGAAAS